MSRSIPTIRAGVLVVERPSAIERLEVASESSAWRQWLESARTFAFEDAGVRFTARKKQRWGAYYWYAFRRSSGRFYETYLGKAADITLSRLRAVGAHLNQLVGQGGAPQVTSPRSAPSEPTDAQRRVAHAARPAERARPRPSRSPLTPRQREVLRLIAAGASNNDIAKTLVIAPSTAKRHVSNIYLTLGVNKRTQAVARAWELGLLSTPDQDPLLPDYAR